MKTLQFFYNEGTKESKEDKNKENKNDKNKENEEEENKEKENGKVYELDLDDFSKYSNYFTKCDDFQNNEDFFIIRDFESPFQNPEVINKFILFLYAI